MAEARQKAAIAIGYALHRKPVMQSCDRVYDEAGNVIEAHEHAGEFKESLLTPSPSDW